MMRVNITVMFKSGWHAEGVEDGVGLPGEPAEHFPAMLTLPIGGVPDDAHRQVPQRRQHTRERAPVKVTTGRGAPRLAPPDEEVQS